MCFQRVDAEGEISWIMIWCSIRKKRWKGFLFVHWKGRRREAISKQRKIGREGVAVLVDLWVKIHQHRIFTMHLFHRYRRWFEFLSFLLLVLFLVLVIFLLLLRCLAFVLNIAGTMPPHPNPNVHPQTSSYPYPTTSSVYFAPHTRSLHIHRILNPPQKNLCSPYPPSSNSHIYTHPNISNSFQILHFHKMHILCSSQLHYVIIRFTWNPSCFNSYTGWCSKNLVPFSPSNTLHPWVYEYKIQSHDTESSRGTLHSLYH